MPHAYDTIEKLFYKDSSAERILHADHIARERLEAESTFRTGIELENGELFLAVPRILSVAHERVLRKERRVSALWRGLPRVALGAYMRSLIADEVFYSNEIEGVRSTRQQVRDALDAVPASNSPHAPFAEFAHLYLGLTDADAAFPTAPEEVRSIYDSVVGNTVSIEDRLGEELFRTDEVYLYNERGKRIHTGVAPERIQPLLRQMLALARADIPEIFCAALCHFVFEYIHPFYDGNGRTGRYLLALQLSEVLSQPTALSLSRVIAQNKVAYYRAFDTVERPLNHAEATPFALTLCDFLLEAQDDLIVDLEDKRAKIDAVRTAIGSGERDWNDRERDVLFFAAQRHLFDLYREIRTGEVAEYLDGSPAVARAALKGLEARGMLRRVGSRPLAYVLADAGMRAVGLRD